MSRYLRILEKANLEKDLFGGGAEAESSADFPAEQEVVEQEEALSEPVEPVAAAVSPVRIESSAPAVTPHSRRRLPTRRANGETSWPSCWAWSRCLTGCVSACVRWGVCVVRRSPRRL